MTEVSKFAKSMFGGISIIIPVYNAESYIANCVKSILNQSIEEFEIICIDDGSTDKSLSILENFSAQESRIEVIHKMNEGASVSRNVGIKHATLKYITFVDADDTIEPEMYKTMVEFAEKSDLDCVVCGANVISGSTKKMLVPPFSDGEIISGERITNDIIMPLIGFSNKSTDALCSLWNKLFKRELIEKYNLLLNKNRTHGEDWQFCIEYFRVSNTVGFLNSPFYNYVHHSKDSLVNKYRDNYFELALMDHNYFKELFPEFDWECKKKITEYQMLPFRAAVYYRSHLDSNKLVLKYQEMFRLIDQYGVYDGKCFVSKGYGIKKAVENDDFHSFKKLIIQATNFEILKNKMKRLAKRILGR